MNRGNLQYKEAIEKNAIVPDSWAAITLCYETSVPDFYVKKLGKKK